MSDEIKSKKAYGIARVSTQYQCDSIEAQTNTIFSYCSKHAYLEFQKLFKLKESAYCLTPKEMDKILADTEPQCAIILAKIDRLTRNIRDFKTFCDMVVQKDIEFHFIQENIIWNKDSDRETENKIMYHIQLAEQESIKTSKRTRECNEIMRACGKITYPAPFGYINYQEGRQKGWKAHSLDSKIVTDIFNWFSTGKFSYQDISNKVKNKYNIKKAKQSIHDILSNKFYIGYAKYQDTEYKHIYETFIPENLFKKCQKIMKNKSKSVSNPKKITKKSALYGLIRDKNTKKLFTPYSKRERSYLKSPVKGISDIKEANIIPKIKQVIKQFNKNNSIQTLIADVINHDNDIETSQLKDKLTTEQNKLNGIKTRLQKVLTTETISDDMLSQSIDMLNKQQQFHLNQIQQINEKLSVISGKTILISPDITQSFDDIDIYNQSILLKTLLKNIWIKNNILTFEFNSCINHKNISLQLN